MDKFGIFDLISKLSSTENKDNPLSKLIDGLVSPNKNQATNAPQIKKGGNAHLKDTPRYNSDAILKIIEKHDKLSKQIDKNQNK